ncbi:hypothetical protein Tsubulata_021352 [Turnera subulata]|uniref:Uncharacterized protein n=1 Tax=Turnera subulata TaxID=218843 RepID=A0A9Q0JKD5_9ROSI|nr:hypothetical protein Tsubulata_021352 [Turnera subulata]
MATDKRGSDLPVSPPRSKKCKVGLQSEARASAHFFHFDLGYIRAVYMKPGRGLMYSEGLKFLPGMGRLVSGGIAYAIGCDCFGGSYQREVWICDLNQGSADVEDKDNDDYTDEQLALLDPPSPYPWKQGPYLTGAKPSPLVFAFRGKIYALSLGHCGGGPLFEFLEEGKWKTLPDPDLLYDLPRPPIITSHLVLDSSLWVRVHHPGVPHKDRTLCFDLIKHEWVLKIFPDAALALCNLWPTRPHAVGRDIHFHAGDFCAVTKLRSDSDGALVGLACCSPSDLLSFFREEEKQRTENDAMVEEDYIAFRGTFARLKETTDPKEKDLLRSSLIEIRDRMTERSVDRYYRERFNPFPQTVVLPDVGFVKGLEPCEGFAEAIFYPPEEDDTNEDSRCRLLAHYHSLPMAPGFGAPWGALILWTFRLNQGVATGLCLEMICYPHIAALLGGTPSILTKPDCEPPPPPRFN